MTRICPTVKLVRISLLQQVGKGLLLLRCDGWKLRAPLPRWLGNPCLPGPPPIGMHEIRVTGCLTCLKQRKPITPPPQLFLKIPSTTPSWAADICQLPTLFLLFFHRLSSVLFLVVSLASFLPQSHSVSKAGQAPDLEFAVTIEETKEFLE